MLIQKYNPVWVRDFEAIKAVIQSALEGMNIKVEHVGSTSVPGLAAKPIIDIDIVLYSKKEFNKINSRLSEIGYYHNGDQGIPTREAFKRKEPSINHAVLDKILHHLYVCPIDSPELDRHLVFRDYLSANESARQAYEKIKRQIAAESNHDYKTYAQLKETRAKGFILSMIELAKKELLSGRMTKFN